MKEKNIRKVVTLSFILPGLGHLYWGLKKKGILLLLITLISIALLIWGGILYAKAQINPPDEEVEMDEMGNVIEKEEPSTSIPWLSINVSLAGLILLTWVGIYGIKDAKRIVKEAEKQSS